MKRKGILMGILGLLLVFGLALVGCKNDSDDGGGGGSGAAIDSAIQGKWYNNAVPPVLVLDISASQIAQTQNGATTTYTARTYTEGAANILEVTIPPNTIQKWTYQLVASQLTVTTTNNGVIGPLVK